jgi:hypothetical protein
LSKAVQPAEQGQGENGEENWPGLPDGQWEKMLCKIQVALSLSF